MLSTPNSLESDSKTQPSSPKLEKKSEEQLMHTTIQFKKNLHHVSKSIGIICETKHQKKHAQFTEQETNPQWTSEEDARLLKLSPIFNQINWFEYMIFFPGHSHIQCRQRLSQLLQNDILVGNWSYREQIAIFKYVRAFKFSWKSIAEMMPRRSQNSIKNYFHSAIRRLKKSDLLEFVRNMVAWPTYTNRCKCFFKRENS